MKNVVKHELKTLREYFIAVGSGDKTFEVRKNDRDYKIGDILILQEYNNMAYTGTTIDCVITYILTDHSGYVLPGYVIMSIKEI